MRPRPRMPHQDGAMIEVISVQGEDDGSAVLPVIEYLEARDGERPVGVYALLDRRRNTQYVGYSRNMVLAIKVRQRANHPANATFDTDEILVPSADERPPCVKAHSLLDSSTECRPGAFRARPPQPSILLAQCYTETPACQGCAGQTRFGK